MGIVLFAPALALEAACYLVLSFSAKLGGLKAVIWTDVFQSVIMFSGVFAVLIKGTIKIGGMGFLFNQSSVQRIISIPTVEQAKRVIWITTPAFFVSVSFAALEGIVAYSYYHTLGCDPLASKHIRNPNQLKEKKENSLLKGGNGTHYIPVPLAFINVLGSKNTRNASQLKHFNRNASQLKHVNRNALQQKELNRNTLQLKDFNTNALKQKHFNRNAFQLKDFNRNALQQKHFNGHAL
ncbi:hypothetical protein KUTeg_012787 [Tegillarca granosa]|uniref:Uncharacterized protein n=1 Tax=Tegillarca granosa TaxID=220873 RepID=A0ABQ9F3U4_TEGGR|nr:hypothetical protein KUTeg_012787 [Tegillarca granosa]